MKYTKRTFLLLWLVFLFAWKTSSYDIGDIVADFTLKNVDGKMISLYDYKSAQGVIVIFDCNTCPYSRIYNDRIINLHQKFVLKGFPVITINPNSPTLSPGDSFDEMVARANSKGYTFPYLVDEHQEVARSFGASNTPHVFVLKKESQGFKVAYIGTIDNNSRDASAVTKNYVEDAVNALLENRTIAMTRTKAIGCGIKWSN
ncbi:MAG: thioredoxin family protein [Cyclobacteriaceae bacterium]|nr:thioredoxin family protein [Cyclobacteriaceae bacterium]MDH4295302.1 thioredoxin family protein [Cyclobacteriaceae bacterium]MDH5249706.1 thioredoxin family protein [Cyclobacteriaceae bacterium]